MIRAFIRWAFNAWLMTVLCFGITALVLGVGGSNVLGAVIIVGVFSPMYILPAATGAVVMEWLWAERVPRLLLGSIAGFLAMCWTWTPGVMLLAAIAGGTAGWIGDRAAPVFSGRWFQAIGLGSLLMGISALAVRAI